MISKKEKACPIMTAGQGELRHCIKGDCELYTSLFTTENIRVEMCSIEAIAVKNSDGKIQV